MRVQGTYPCRDSYAALTNTYCYMGKLSRALGSMTDEMMTILVERWQGALHLAGDLRHVTV